MKTYTVNFTSKATGKIVHTVTVETDNVNTVRMQAKLKALSQDDFKFNKRKHDLSSPDF
jgi:hypothetical protein